jgi:hypothetical protein
MAGKHTRADDMNVCSALAKEEGGIVPYSPIGLIIAAPLPLLLRRGGGGAPMHLALEVYCVIPPGHPLAVAHTEVALALPHKQFCHVNSLKDASGMESCPACARVDCVWVRPMLQQEGKRRQMVGCVDQSRAAGCRPASAAANQLCRTWPCGEFMGVRRYVPAIAARDIRISPKLE